MLIHRSAARDPRRKPFFSPFKELLHWRFVIIPLQRDRWRRLETTSGNWRSKSRRKFHSRLISFLLIRKWQLKQLPRLRIFIIRRYRSIDYKLFNFPRRDRGNAKNLTHWNIFSRLNFAKIPPKSKVKFSFSVNRRIFLLRIIRFRTIREVQEAGDYISSLA